MEQLISPLCPFPNIYWWLIVENCSSVTFDHAEHYEKMSYRNRYYITGANGFIQLSLPLVKGRNQRTPMKEVMLDNSEHWQKQHWRSIFSAYGNAPFFEFFAPALELMFNREYKWLVDFCTDSIDWAKQQTGINFNVKTTSEYNRAYAGAIDIRQIFKPGIEKQAVEADKAIYYQLFSERNGFYPNLSILDILFSEGPAALQTIKANKKIIENWS